MTNRRWLNAALARAALPLPAPLPWTRSARRRRA